MDKTTKQLNETKSHERRVWQTPRILSRGPLEAVASTCTGPSAKAVLGQSGCIAPIGS